VAAGDADAGSAMAYPMFDAAPFSYGVASGDATPSSFMAWTRVDGPGSVTLEVASDDAFTTIVFTTAASPNTLGDNTVKLDVTGLLPATQYFYRFIQGMAVSRVGRVKTAPLPASIDPVRFAWTGDSNAFFKPYTVLDPVLGDEPDVWFYIGDTIYGDDPRSGTGVAVTRADYHTKYKENRDDASLRNVLAAFGTVAQWDDHEVTNDFYGTDMTPGFQAQMTAGNEALRDYMPIRDDGGDPLQLYRSFQWGQAAEFFLLDDRQYRSAQAYVTEPTCLDMGEPIVVPAGTCAAEISNPSRTYLGAAQKQWLKDGLLNSTATFKFVMNGPLISSLIFLPYDRWDGYTAERTELIDYIKTNDIRNVIFLSTDIHALIVNSQVGDAMPPIIQEWVSGAIGMDPIYRELPASIATVVPNLPIIFFTITYFDIDRFNYGVIDVSPTDATVTYRDATGAVLKQLTVPAT
jgi:alkaline phosphatase D